MRPCLAMGLVLAVAAIVGCGGSPTLREATTVTCRAARTTCAAVNAACASAGE